MARAARKPIPQLDTTAANDVGPGHNGGGLTSDQRQALALMHRRIYRTKMAAKKEADAAVKNACKVIKADLGEFGLLQVKEMMVRETPEGAAKADAELKAKTEVRVWVSDDRQLDMFPTAVKAAESEAYQQGKIAGMDDEACRSPYGPETADSEDWIRGWGVGKKIMDELLAERAEHAELITGGDLDDEGGDE
jgi:hypothetical protein